jgi:TatD DNase family protein
MDSMGLIDSHAHLTDPGFGDPVDEVLKRGAAAGVDTVITIGMTLDDAQAAIRLAERYPDRVYAAVGMHPHEAGKVTDDDLQAMATLWGHPRVVAAGEIGLDYHYEFADRAAQRRIFARQLELADPRACPIVIHSRKAFDDTEEVLLEQGFGGRPVVFHCFTGTESEVARVLEHGWWVSFTGVVTFKNAREVQQIAKDYPADKLMLETDAPYLAPEPVRNRPPNEPAYLAHVARFLAELRGEAYEDLVEQTAGNTRCFFRLPEA